MDDWRRTARVLWVVQFLTTLAMNLGLTFVPFLLADDPVLRVADPVWRTFYVGLVLGAPFVTTIVFTPIWGWVADRTGPKPQVIRACVGLGASQLLLAVVQSPDQMVAVRVLQGVVSGVLAACLGHIASVTPTGYQGRAITFVQSATPAGQVFAPLVGLLLAATLGFRATYALLGSLILFAGLLSWLLLRDQRAVTAPSPGGPFRGLWAAGREALAEPGTFRAMTMLVAAHFAFTVAQGVFAIYAARLVAHSDVWSGFGFTAVAFAVTGLASAVASPIWGRFHDRGASGLTALGAGLMAVSLLPLLLGPPWWAVLLSRVGVGAGIAATSTLPFAALSRQTPPPRRGQMMGLATALTQVGNLAGFLLGGVLAAWWSLAGNFALAAAVYVVVAVGTLVPPMRPRAVPATC